MEKEHRSLEPGICLAELVMDGSQDLGGAVALDAENPTTLPPV